LRKFLLLLCVLMLVVSLPTLAKKTQDFETGAWGDSAWGWATTRDFNRGAGSWITFTNAIAHGGSQSVMLPLVDTMPMGLGALHLYLMYCKSAFWSNGICNDSVFMHEDIGIGDSLWSWFYCPASAEVDSIIFFARDSNWGWCVQSIYQYEDLTMDAWNCLTCVISDSITGASPRPTALPMVQYDIWMYVDSMYMNSNCTLYVDDISTLERGAGVVEGPDGMVLTASINSVKLSLSKSALVTLSIYNVLGQKEYEAAGTVDAGDTDVELGDLANGVHIVKVVSGAGSTKLAKLIIAK
jgi:hypothetical protein